MYTKLKVNAISSLPIDASDVWRALPRMSGMTDYTDDLHIMMSQSAPLLAPSFAYCICDVDQMKDEAIKIGSTVLHCGNEIAQALHGSTQAAVIACTVGEGIIRQYNVYLQDSDFVKAYLCDILANVAIEKMMQMVKGTLRKEIEPYQLGITSHFCPGNCNWDIKEQSKLLSLLPEEYCPVTLTSSFLMLPMKSLSSIVGIGTNVKYKKSSCASCQSGKCIYRKNNQKNSLV